ncbi:MAG: hypothetical protein GYB66_13335, partial [Chloroflexi bacterium]|nr:hypothetical protein [Chloroflexota bacterium]
LAVAGYNGMLQLWDVENGMLISAAESRSSLIQSIAFSPDDSLIVTGNFDGKVELWAVTDDPMPDAQPSESSSAEEDAGQPSEPGERPLAPRELPTMVIGLGENYFTSDIKTNVTQKLTYEGSAGEELTLAFNGYGVRITVVAPSGEILAEFNEAQSVDLVLPENGQYQIELFGETGGLVSLTLSNTR